MRSSPTTMLHLPALVGFALLACSPLLAQVAQPDPEEADVRAAGGERARAILDGLSNQDRQRFRAAMNEIWHADKVEASRQAMQEANLAYREALQAEIRDSDAPSDIRGILLKILQLRFSDEARTSDPSPRLTGDRDGPAALSREDRAILKAARTQAEASAPVIAAKDEVAGAVTTRERSAASAQYRRAMRRAMEEADARVKQILARRDQRPRTRAGDRPEPGRPARPPKPRKAPPQPPEGPALPE